MSKNKRVEIETAKAILVEGKDGENFARRALHKFGLQDIWVYDFGGNESLKKYLSVFVKSPDFEKITSLLILRDAELNFYNSFRSVANSLASVDLGKPDASFKFTKTSPKIAIAFFPAFKKDSEGEIIPKDGTLEDLCLEALSDNSLAPLAKQYLKDVEQNSDSKLKRRHKNLLHSYFSATDDFVGKKIGEAVRDNVLNWDHEMLQNFKDLIQEM